MEAILLKLIPAIWVVVGPLITGGIRWLIGKVGASVPPLYAPLLSGVATAVLAGLSSLDPAMAAAGGVAGQLLNDRKPGHDGESFLDGA